MLKPKYVAVFVISALVVSGAYASPEGSRSAQEAMFNAAMRPEAVAAGLSVMPGTVAPACAVDAGLMGVNYAVRVRRPLNNGHNHTPGHPAAQVQQGGKPPYPAQQNKPSASGGGCNPFGCYDAGGGCNSSGCWEAGGGCNPFGCYDAGGGCNSSGCWGSDDDDDWNGNPPPHHTPGHQQPGHPGYPPPYHPPHNDEPETPGGCNPYGCYDAGGGCNGYGCWTDGGGCNAYGCWIDDGGCNGYGCWGNDDDDDWNSNPPPHHTPGHSGYPPLYQLPHDDESDGGCNAYGCYTAGGGCNAYGCWE